jgi:cytochrome c556
MPQDLTPQKLEELTWEEGNRADCLKHVYAHVVKDANDAIKWYQLSRKPKKKMAMSLRWSAVLLLSASGLLPLISELWKPLAVNALATSLCVAVAAALFGLDKLFNYSTGWMRYVQTDLLLRTALAEFEFDWQLGRLAWASNQPTPEQANQMLTRCKEFAARINAIVSEETNVWITEFQASLAQLGESVKTAEARVAADTAKREEAAKAVGALNVTVKHNGQTYGGKFKLKVNNEQDGKLYVGSNIALVGLSAGPNKVEAEFTDGGKVHRGEFAFDVEAGKTQTVELAVTPES